MKKRIVSMLLALAMLLSLLPISALAADRVEGTPYGQVRVIVENTTFTMDEGAPWDGVLVDTWVDLTGSSTAMDCIVDALMIQYGYSCVGWESNYISEINGLYAGAAGYAGAGDGYDGWMVTLNDWFTNQGIGAYGETDGSLVDGDEIKLMYSCYGMGEDLGGSFYNNDKTVKNVTFSVGTLNQPFNPQIIEYGLFVPAGTTSIVVTPTATNKNFQVRTTDMTGQEYKRTAKVPVFDGSVIYVTCGDPSWPTMNGGGYGDADNIPGVQYVFHIVYETDTAVQAVIDKISAIGTVTLESEAKITAARTDYNALTSAQKSQVTNYSKLTAAETALAVLKQEAADQEKAAPVIAKIEDIGTVTLNSEEAITAARTAYDALTDTQKALVTNYAVLTKAEQVLDILKLPQPDVDAIYETTGDHLENLAASSVPVVSSTGGEWLVLGLVRSGRNVPAGYYENVVEYVKENINDKEQLHRRKSTDSSRVILALTAAGYDVTNVDGHNLLVGLSDYDYTVWQGINAAVFALIAFDSGNYEIPTVYEGGVQNTREKMIGYILDKQLDDGGWALGSYQTADVDVTAMTIQSLAPYYDTNAEVKAAVDEALTMLSARQNINGVFGSVDGACSESCAQVVVALTALGIDPDTDPRFVKNGRSVLDAMCDFYVEGGGFKHILSGTWNGMASEQAYYALAAYYRFENGQTSLYNMTDAVYPKETVALIDAIGMVTLDSETAITAARNAYDTLSDYQKTLVSNYDILTAAEKSLADQKAAAEKAAADKATADAVIAKINAIGTVTKDSEAAIRDARAAYEALTDVQKALVSNYKTLTDAESVLAALKAEDNTKPTDPEDTRPTDPEDTTKPTTPADPSTPQTGDNTNIALYTTLMITSLACIAALLLVFKKKEGKYSR